jgi:hypothetical protein
MKINSQPEVGRQIRKVLGDVQIWRRNNNAL